MKSIELTEEHRSKLLEMCNKLFPEYTLILFDDQSNYYLENEEILSFCNDNEIIQIHWFEFCMTHLAKKIIPKVTNYNLDSAYDSLYNVIYQFWETKHNNIVDYLYEEFKKLKQ